MEQDFSADIEDVLDEFTAPLAKENVKREWKHRDKLPLQGSNSTESTDAEKLSAFGLHIINPPSSVAALVQESIPLLAEHLGMYAEVYNGLDKVTGDPRTG